MKKSLLSLFIIVALASCTSGNKLTPKIMVPNGTPAVAIANYAVNHLDDVSVVSPTELAPAFTSAEKEIIIAPINLGARFYNAAGKYGLYRTIVWDNLYLISRHEVKTISDLQGKKISSFGQGSTPNIVLDTILSHFNVVCDIDYSTEVALSNSLYTAGSYDYALTAQPTINAIKSSSDYVISLTDFWKQSTGMDSYPQSAIFVRIDEYANIKKSLKEIDLAFDNILDNVDESAKNAASITTLKEQLLKIAIPDCGFKSIDNEKEVVETYYELMLEMGGSIAQSLGGKLPDENFYLR